MYWFMRSAVVSIYGGEMVCWFMRSESIKSYFPWPTNSPGPNPLDFYLRAFVKHEVFAANPQSIDETKELIRSILAAIPQETLQRTIGNFDRRLDLCIAAHGGILKRINTVYTVKKCSVLFFAQ